MVMPPAKWERRRQGDERRGVRSHGASRWSTGRGALWSSGTQYVQWGWGTAVASGAWAGQWPMKTQVWMCPPGAADGTRMPGPLSAVGPFQFLRKAGNLYPERDVRRKLAGGPGPSEPSMDHSDESPGKSIPRELSLGREQLLLGGDWPQARQLERSLLSPLRLVPDPADQAGHCLPGPRQPPRPSPAAPPQLSTLDNSCGLTKPSASRPPVPSLTLPPPGMLTRPRLGWNPQSFRPRGSKDLQGGIVPPRGD